MFHTHFLACVVVYMFRTLLARASVDKKPRISEGQTIPEKKTFVALRHDAKLERIILGH